MNIFVIHDVERGRQEKFQLFIVAAPFKLVFHFLILQLIHIGLKKLLALGFNEFAVNMQ